MLWRRPWSATARTRVHTLQAVVSPPTLSVVAIRGVESQNTLVSRVEQLGIGSSDLKLEFAEILVNPDNDRHSLSAEPHFKHGSPYVDIPRVHSSITLYNSNSKQTASGTLHRGPSGPTRVVRWLLYRMCSLVLSFFGEFQRLFSPPFPFSTLMHISSSRLSTPTGGLRL